MGLVYVLHIIYLCEQLILTNPDMSHYVSPDVEVQNLEPVVPLAASGSSEGFGSKPGTYDILKPGGGFGFCLVALLVTGLLTACNPEKTPSGLGSGFTATAEAHQPQTSTSLSGGDVLWRAGDTIAVYKADSLEDGIRSGLNPFSDGQAEGEFEMTGHEEWLAYSCYALYPASMDGGFTGSKWNINLPAVQEWCPGSFGPAASPAVACNNCSGKLAFKNLCGLLSVSVTAAEAIAEVRLTTLGEEALWGPGSVEMPCGTTPALVMAAPADEAQKTLTLKVVENPEAGENITVGAPIPTAGGVISGSTPTPRQFYFVVPVGTLAQGFLVTVITAEHKFMQQHAVAKESNQIERSVCTGMPDLAFEDQSEVEIRTDVPNKAYYKDLLMDSGIGLSEYRTMPCTRRLNLSTETLVAATNNATNQSVQNRYLIGDATDENGILLYPDGEPRYKSVYVNGGVATTHGRSLMAGGRDHFRTYVNNGGCYMGSCAGSFVATIGVIDTYIAHNGYMGLWPGLADNTSTPVIITDYIIPEDSPLLRYDSFGGDFRVDSIKHHNGPYFEHYYRVPGTEVLARNDCKVYDKFQGHPSIISYHPSPWRGRVTLLGGHPEQYEDGLEGAHLMDAVVRYTLGDPGIAKVKAVLRNGEKRQMTRSTSDEDPAHTKIGDRQCHHFVFAQPEGAKNIRIRLESLEDFNLSLRLAKGTFAFAEDATSRVENTDRVKELSFSTLEKGTWYIGVQCEDTVSNNSSHTNGISYSGKTAVLNGAPYTIQVIWE